MGRSDEGRAGEVHDTLELAVHRFCVGEKALDGAEVSRVDGGGCMGAAELRGEGVQLVLVAGAEQEVGAAVVKAAGQRAADAASGSDQCVDGSIRHGHRFAPLRVADAPEKHAARHRKSQAIGFIDLDPFNILEKFPVPESFECA